MVKCIAALYHEISDIINITLCTVVFGAFNAVSWTIEDRALEMYSALKYTALASLENFFEDLLVAPNHHIEGGKH